MYMCIYGTMIIKGCAFLDAYNSVYAINAYNYDGTV